MKPWGEDPRKWIIKKLIDGTWAVFPPVGSFWGKGSYHDTGEEALADYRRQTECHVPQRYLMGVPVD